MADISGWFQSLPIFTRWWFALSVAFPLLGRLGIFNPYHMAWLWDPFFYDFQIWRPFTSIFFYPISRGSGFHFLMNLYFLYSYSLRLETGIFDGRPADYCVCLSFLWIGSLISGAFMGFPWLMDTLVMSILHIWCQLNHNEIVSFWFGTQFKAFYLPWVLLLLNLVLSGSYATQLSGILIGHLYYFMKFKYPVDFNGPSFLNTPSFLYRYFPTRAGSTRSFAPMQRSASSATPPQPTQARGHNWGQGHVLGND